MRVTFQYEKDTRRRPWPCPCSCSCSCCSLDTENVIATYVLKVIFAQRMMGNLNHEKLLPLEQHAKAFSGAKNATMNRLLYQDIHRTLHWPYAIASVDLGDCYDAPYHGWSAISLLAAGVPNSQVKMMLVALQCMGWQIVRYSLSRFR